MSPLLEDDGGDSNGFATTVGGSSSLIPVYCRRRNTKKKVKEPSNDTGFRHVDLNLDFNLSTLDDKEAMEHIMREMESIPFENPKYSNSMLGSKVNPNIMSAFEEEDKHTNYQHEMNKLF